jgi:hypothetical protein
MNIERKAEKVSGVGYTFRCKINFLLLTTSSVGLGTYLELSCLRMVGTCVKELLQVEILARLEIPALESLTSRGESPPMRNLGDFLDSSSSSSSMVPGL